MLSKGFVEAHLRMYIDSCASYGVHLYSVRVKSSMFSYMTLSDILEFSDVLSPDFYFSIYVVPSFTSCIIDLYSDRITVFSCTGELLHVFRED